MSRSVPENITQEDLRIPLVEEQLTVGTRVVETGRGVRIHKTISEQPVVIDERLVREEMAIERVPARARSAVIARSTSLLRSGRCTSVTGLPSSPCE